MAAGKKYKNTTEKIRENSALGTLVLLVITSPFILGLNSEAVALVLRSAKLPAHINTASVSQVPVCKHWMAILFLSASILSFLDAEALKELSLHRFGTAGSSSQLKALWYNTDHYKQESCLREHYLVYLKK